FRHRRESADLKSRRRADRAARRSAISRRVALTERAYSMLSSIIIGGGPGGLGALIWAAQQGLLPAWLDRGVAVVERQTYLGGTLGRCGIHSDSLGGSYLECLEASGLPPELQPLIHEPVAREM